MSRFRKLSQTIWHCQYHLLWTPKYRFRILQYSRRAAHLQRQREAAKRERAELGEATRLLERDKKVLTRDETQTADQLNLLEAQQLGVPVLKLKDDLERELARLDDEVITHSSALININAVRKANRDLADRLGQLLGQVQLAPSAAPPPELLEPLEAVVTRDDLDRLAIGRLLSEKNYPALADIAGHVVDIDKVHRTLVERFADAAETLDRRHFQYQEQVQRTQDRINRLKGEIDRLEKANQVAYPQTVRRALALIHG